MFLRMISSAARLSIISVLILTFLTASLTAQETSHEQPNIVLFLVDDMGWQDTSVPFWDSVTAYNRLYTTPNMERLAAQGMKFTQAYATPVCSPTRISLMTGMNAVRHRVTNWTLHKDALQPMETNHQVLDFPRWNVNGLSPVAGDPLAVHATPMPQMLMDAGYFTVHCGKAHLGAIGTPGEDPLNLGFDVNIAGHAAGAPASYHGKDDFGIHSEHGSVWGVPGLEKYHGTPINLTEALTREALASLDQRKNEGPFFLYMSHYAVHTPIMADSRFVQKYYDLGLDSVEARYASMVESMDKSLGDILDYLAARDLADETIVLFMSDNGGLSAVARGGEKHTHNVPLSSGKGSMHEGGVREPMMVSWPGVVKPGSSTDQYLIIEDFFATILEMAGVDQNSAVQDIDGQSFVPMLKGKQMNYQERPLVWHYPNEWGPTGPGIGAASAIRLGDYKLIYYHQDQRMELFNISEDIAEEQNLVEENPAQQKVLAKKLSDYLRDKNAQMPRIKSTGEVVPYPDGMRD